MFKFLAKLKQQQVFSLNVWVFFLTLCRIRWIYFPRRRELWGKYVDVKASVSCLWVIRCGSSAWWIFSWCSGDLKLKLHRLVGVKRSNITSASRATAPQTHLTHFYRENSHFQMHDREKKLKDKKTGNVQYFKIRFYSFNCIHINATNVLIPWHFLIGFNWINFCELFIFIWLCFFILMQVGICSWGHTWTYFILHEGEKNPCHLTSDSVTVCSIFLLS